MFLAHISPILATQSSSTLQICQLEQSANENKRLTKLSRQRRKKWRKDIGGVPTVAQQKCIQLVSMRLWVQSLASLRGLRIWHRRELWCRSQTRIPVLLWLWCRLAADVTPRPGTSICLGCAPHPPKKERTVALTTLAPEWHLSLAQNSLASPSHGVPTGRARPGKCRRAQGYAESSASTAPTHSRNPSSQAHALP